MRGCPSPLLASTSKNCLNSSNVEETCEGRQGYAHLLLALIVIVLHPGGRLNNDKFYVRCLFPLSVKVLLPLCETELSRLAKLLQQAAFSSRDKQAAENPGDMMPSDGDKSDKSDADLSRSFKEFDKSSASFISNFKSMRKRQQSQKDDRNAKKQRKNSASSDNFRQKRVQ